MKQSAAPYKGFHLACISIFSASTRLFFYGCLTALSLVALSGCNRSQGDAKPEDGPDAPGVGDTIEAQWKADAAAIQEVVMSIPLPIELAPPPPDPVLLASETSETENAEDNTRFYTCTTERYSFGQNFTEIAGFNPTEDVVWPGALVQGRTLSTGIPSRIRVAHAPLRITISPSETDDNSVVVEEPSFSTVAGAVEKLTEKLPDVTPAALSFDRAEVVTTEQALLKIGLAASWIGGNARAQLARNTSAETNELLIKFVQRYYTVTAEPVRPERRFGYGVSTADLSRYVSVADSSTAQIPNAPAFVSTVNYGRMYVFKLSSKRSMNEIDAAVHFAQSFPGGTVDGEFQNQLREAFSDIRIQKLAIGGNSEDAVEVITADELAKLLKAGATANEESPGEPISYTVRYLRNDDVAAVNFTTDYEVTECRPLSVQVEVEFQNFFVVADCEDLWDGAPDLTWEFKVNNATVVHNPNEVQVGEGDTFGLGQKTRVTLDKRRGESITVWGELIDHDGASTNDRLGPFAHTYRYMMEDWTMGPKEFELEEASDCKIRVRYRINEV